MIAYDLQCSQGHTFEGWFEDEKAYSHQKKKEMIACPVCNDTEISRIPSTFAIKGSQSVASLANTPEAKPFEAVEQQLIEYVHKNFDDVAPRKKKRR